MTSEDVLEEHERLSRQIEMKRKIIDDTKAKEIAAEHPHPVPQLDAWQLLSEGHKADLLYAYVTSQGVSLARLEQLYSEQKAERARVETRERIAAQKGKEDEEKQRRASNLVLFKKLRPYSRIMPLDWEHYFEITSDGILRAVGDRKCDCGHDYAVDIINCIDAIWNSDGKFGWFTMAHACRQDPKNPHTGRTKIGGSFGIFVDMSALASASLGGKPQWSTGLPAGAAAARPVI